MPSAWGLERGAAASAPLRDDRRWRLRRSTSRVPTSSEPSQESRGRVHRLLRRYREQTLKRWLERQPGARDLAGLQAQLDAFRLAYNEQRPHRAIGTFRARALHDTSGEGTTGVDDEYAQAYFAEVGAEVIGAGMFGLHAAAHDPDWRGWWGDEPPFHVPV